MEKRIWTKPQAVVENFEVNEYIAKCDDLINKYYAFTCDAGIPDTYNTVYYETNGVGGFQRPSMENWFSGDSHKTSTYHPCGIKHYAKQGETVFIDGYIVTRDSAEAVIIWEGANSDNVHCTKALVEDIKTVTGNKS